MAGNIFLTSGKIRSGGTTKLSSSTTSTSSSTTSTSTKKTGTTVKSSTTTKIGGGRKSCCGR